MCKQFFQTKYHQKRVANNNNRFFIHFLNLKLSFMFRYRYRRSTKKFDFNRQKKSKIKLTINENVNINLFQSLHCFYNFDKTFTFEQNFLLKFALFIFEFVFKSSTKKKTKKTTRIVLNKKSTFAKIVRSNENFTINIIETLNIKNCFYLIVSNNFFEL